MDESDNIEVGQQTHTSVREIKAILRDRNEQITARDEIKAYVEPPLVDACERFWDMNVMTLSSSANSKNIGYEAYIIIDYNSLSEENKEIAKNSGEFLEDYDGRPAVGFLIPVSEPTTPEEIKAKADEVASRFQKQKATWIPSYTLQEMRQWYGIEPDDDEFGVVDFEEADFYYDSKSKKFFLSEEHFQKTKENID